MAGSAAFNLSRALQGVDQFRMVSRDLTRGTLSGGLFTMIAYVILLLVIISELGAFVRTTYQTNIVMDQNQDTMMQINFDILMYDLPCKYLQLGVWDKFGEERVESRGHFHYIPVDHTGSNRGMVYTKEEIAVLEMVDQQTDVSDGEKDDIDADWSSSSDHFRHSDFHGAVTFHDFTLVNFFAEWCSHCRKFSPMWKQAAEKISEKMTFMDGNGRSVNVKFLKINCVDFGDKCKEAQVAAFPSIRLYKRDGTFESFKQKRSIDNIIVFLTSTIRNSHLITARHHSIFSEGCQVQGTLSVPRVPGHFHLQAEAFGDVDVNPAITNVSHKVNHLSFGLKDAEDWARMQNIPKEMVTHITPLDGMVYKVERFHEAPQHYLKVVSTRVQGKSQVFYQMTHTERVRKMRLESNADRLAPQARFSYDFSPMSVVVKSKNKRWYEFLTSLFAILGGTYTIVELCSGAVDTVQNVVKEAIGKAN